jgi:hypothetical protein
VKENRMRTKKLTLIVFVLLAVGIVTPGVALCDVPPDASIPAPPDAVDAGPPSSSTTAGPAADIANPVDDPLGAIDDVRQAKKQGWSLVLLCLLVMTTAGLARAAERWPSKPVLATIAKNKTLLFVIACVGAMAAAAYNAAFVGGSPYAVAYAAGGALLLFVAPKPKAAT